MLAKHKLLTIGAISIVLALCIFTSWTVSASIHQATKANEEPQVVYEDRILSDWEVFVMALVEVESEYDSTAWNETSGATGYLQITRPYLNEYNRRYMDTIKLKDCFNPDINLRVFYRINEALNPTFDFDEAIYLHNPTAGGWYRTRVYNKMEDVLRREQARYKITQICNGN